MGRAGRGGARGLRLGDGEARRRALEAVPPWLGGPSFWRENVIEPAPESIYAEYSGTTMPGAKPGGIDTFRILLNNILQFLLGNDSQDGAVASWDVQGAFSRAGPKEFLSAVASGDLQRLVGGPLFLLLQKYYLEDGPIYKLAFGPRSFFVISDPVASRSTCSARTRPATTRACSRRSSRPSWARGSSPPTPTCGASGGACSCPASTWRWLERMTGLFSECSVGLLAELGAAAATAASADARARSGRPRPTSRRGAAGGARARRARRGARRSAASSTWRRSSAA